MIDEINKIKNTLKYLPTLEKLNAQKELEFKKLDPLKISMPPLYKKIDAIRALIEE